MIHLETFEILMNQITEYKQFTLVTYLDVD